MSLEICRLTETFGEVPNAKSVMDAERQDENQTKVVNAPLHKVTKEPEPDEPE